MRVSKPKPDAPQNDQQTVSRDQDPGQAPTINMPPGQASPGFVRAKPYETPPPQPQQRPATPFAPIPPAGPFGPSVPPTPAAGGYQAPAPAAGDQTQIISARTPPVFAWLVVVDGPDRDSIGKVHSLHPDMTTVGRAQGNSIVLSDQTCSSQHIRIRMETAEGEEPSFVLYDMGSRNGTFVGTRASYRNPESQTYRHNLKDGDYLLVGETTLAFKRL
jgi:hypothetical protein